MTSKQHAAIVGQSRVQDQCAAKVLRHAHQGLPRDHRRQVLVLQSEGVQPQALDQMLRLREESVPAGIRTGLQVIMSLALLNQWRLIGRLNGKTIDWSALAPRTGRTA